jgi:hypothetical protein
MANPREKIINFYIELNRSLQEPMWKGLSFVDQKHLRNSINIMTIEVLNGFLFTVVVEDTLSWLNKKTTIDIKYLRSLLLRPPQSYTLIKSLSVTDNDTDGVTIFSLAYTEIDTMKVVVREDKGAELKLHSYNELVALIERYYILQPDGGFFWSGPPDLYKFLALKQDGLIETVEGFGSPFNHNYLDAYCSLYPDDRSFGSIGNFFHQIVHRGNENDKGYRRWIINPPFTYKIIGMVYEAITLRMNYYPNDEYYFILPSWAPVKFLTMLETRGSVINLSSGTYKMYNHITNEYFYPMNSIIFASLSPNDQRLTDANIYITPLLTN